jgi:uncharacterized protein YjbI with pentapeptide repeats
MANEEHLDLLKQGVPNWNDWRRENPTIKPDLSRIDLSFANLRFINLSFANVSNARLIYADLISADLRNVDLSIANLSNANLTRTKLSDGDLCSANLSHVALHRANLKNANFSCANLSDADLSAADFSSANLKNTRLVRVQALATNFTSAELTGACLHDWHINGETKLDNVRCDFVYQLEEWDYISRRMGCNNRRPSSGNFAPGEFALLFKKALDTVDLIFADGIDWQAFFQSFRELRSQYDDKISIQAIEKKSGEAFVIRLEVPLDTDKGAIESKHTELYLRLTHLEERVSDYKNEVKFLRESNTNLHKIVGTMADNQTTNQTTIHADNIGFVNSGSGKVSQFSQTIGQNADEITRLITTLREQSHQFPEDQRDAAQMSLDDLQQDLSTPEKIEPKRLKQRIIALLTIAGVLGTTIATATDFINNAFELADKFEIPQSELLQYVPTHLLPPNQP